jgi:hypothetical protein
LKSRTSGEFLADVTLGVEQEFGDGDQELGVAPGNAVGGDEMKEFADDVMNVADGVEAAGEIGEFTEIAFRSRSPEFVIDEVLLAARVKRRREWGGRDNEACGKCVRR